MEWIIPGTDLSAVREEADLLPDQFSSIFLAGNIALSQVAKISGLEPYTIQNWVKRGFLSPPENKRYSLRQLCRVLTINMLKPALPMEKICSLLGYINGQLNDETDDLIDDAMLYFVFVKLASRVENLRNTEVLNQALDEILSEYTEPYPGAGKRVENVLKIMLTAWTAAKIQHKAEQMLENLSEI